MVSGREEAIFFSALTAEHQQRLQHLDGALGRVAERSRELGLRRNALRQEEITEEIELIMLNLPSTGAGDRHQEDAAAHRGARPGLAP